MDRRAAEVLLSPGGVDQADGARLDARDRPCAHAPGQLLTDDDLPDLEGTLDLALVGEALARDRERPRRPVEPDRPLRAPHPAAGRAVRGPGQLDAVDLAAVHDGAHRKPLIALTRERRGLA